MVELSKMDSKALIAAALAPNTDFPNLGDNGYSSKRLPDTNNPVQKNQAPNGSLKRGRRAASVSSQTLNDQDALPVAKQSQRKESGLSFGETSARGQATGADHQHGLKITHTNNYDGDDNDNVYDNENEGQDRGISTQQQRSRTEKPAESTKKQPKRLSAHGISPRELADLFIDNERYPRKVKGAYGYNMDLGKNADDNDREDGINREKAIRQAQVGRSPAPTSTPRPVKKKPRLIISSDPFTPSPPGSPIPSPEPEEVDEDSSSSSEDEYTDSPPSSQKRNPTPPKSKSKPKPKSTTAKPKPKPQKPSPPSKRSASAKNRRYNFPVASTISEASEADKMMLRMRGEGRPWKDITAEWSRLTGTRPGASSLSVRYLHLKDKFKRMGDPDFARLLTFKESLEKTFNQTEKWDRIAEMIGRDGGGTYTGPALRLKFKNLVEAGLQGENPDVAGRVGYGGIGGFGGGGGGGEGSVFGGSLDDLDRELMGEEVGGDGVAGVGDEEDGDPETPSKKSRGGRVGDGDGDGGPAEAYEMDEYVDDDGDDFMDGELVGETE